MALSHYLYIEKEIGAIKSKVGELQHKISRLKEKRDINPDILINSLLDTGKILLAIRSIEKRIKEEKRI